MTKVDEKEYKIRVDIGKKGYSEIQEGVYLCDWTSLIEDQTFGDEEDESEGMDFSIYHYWIITDSGEEPEGFDSITSAMKRLA